MKRISIFLLIALLLTVFTGCEKWLDVNQNPNDLTNSTKELVLTAATKTFGERQQMGSGFSLLGAWVGYYGHSGGWSGWNNVKSYRIIASDFNGFWDPYYGDLTNLKYVADKATADGNMTFVAVAKIMRATIFQRIVDVYGDVPYSEAVQGFNGITNAKYDDAQDIYDDLIDELDWAITELDNIINDPGRAGTETMGDEDLINHGDRTMWLQYANTIKLRMLLQQSDMTPDRTAYIQGKIDATAALGYVSSQTTGHITMNPGYQANISGKMNPLFSGYGRNYQGNLTDAHQQYGLNAYLHHLYTSTSDPRMQICWLPGVAAGANYNNPAQLGQDAATAPHWNSLAILMSEGIYGPEGTQAGGNGSGDMIVMSTMEADFLIAEAIQRGFLASYEGMTAQQWYEEAIWESFYYYGMNKKMTLAAITTDFDTYMAQAIDLVDWASSANKLKAIIYQKYIAGVGVYHFSAWSDYRRTGWPEPDFGTDWSLISHYFDIVAAQMPVRLAYPQRELDLNNINVVDAITKTGLTNDAMFIMNARIFWDKE
jgi:hypothetical protein